jgi:kumamolisin
VARITLARRLAGLAFVLLAALSTTARAQSRWDEAARLPLPGHVLPVLDKATPAADVAALLKSAAEPMTITVVLRRNDPAGFSAYLRAVYDPGSSSYRQFLSQAELTSRFGPRPEDYAAVRAYFTAQGLVVTDTADNRLTLSLEGTRAQVEHALGVPIRDYTLGTRKFHAAAGEPSLPAAIAPLVQAVAGLNDLAVARPLWSAINQFFANATCDGYRDLWTYNLTTKGLSNKADLDKALNQKTADCKSASKTASDAVNYGNSHADPPPPAWQGVNGAGQTVGIVAFDTFDPNDVTDYLHLTGSTFAPGNLSRVHVNGGATPGAAQSEVLLDIDTVVALAPGAAVKVFDAPFTAGSFQAVLNAMIDAGVDVITNSWAYCEDQTTLADVQSIDAILQTAAAAGISVFSGAGDRGSTCLDGSADTAHVPASSPHITAVGGSSLVPGPGSTYLSESWWNDPAGAQGGFGTSRFFSRPAYQDSHTPSAMRSLPDVVANADPRLGMIICQAANGGCPNGLMYGGTSSSAPMWAAYAALLNQAQGSRLGFLNPSLYSLAATDSFHPPARLASDFAHVGLGSPNLARLHQHLTSQSPGPTSAAVSLVHAYLAPGFMSVPEGFGLPVYIRADGVSKGYVVVRLADANGNIVSGRNVALSASPQGSVVIAPANGISSDDNGAVVFIVTDSAPETITFTATDTTSNVVLQQTAVVAFAVPAAASASIAGAPSTVAADGASTATITITLQDSLHRPTPGKTIALSQGSGHSIVTGPSPAVTDATGQIQFTVTDTVGESVTYTAVDVSDGDLPVPGSATITFTGGNVSCVTPPTPAAGYNLATFANGFAARNFFFGNINFTGCPGASNPAFGNAGDLYVADFATGDLYKLGANGGTVSSANKLSNLGPTFGNLVFGKDGNLYATHFSPSNVVQIDATSGAVLRTLASGYTCPGGLVVDPLSGDLFFDDGCTGGGSDNPSIWRIRNPGGASPSVTVYANLPSTPGGQIAFAPSGTMYAVASAYNNASMPIVRISGTNGQQPPTVTTLQGVTSDDGSIAVAETLPGGEAKSLLVHTGGALQLVDITSTPFTFTKVADGTINAGVIGPDGCVYVNAHDAIRKLSVDAGCTFNPTNPSPALVLSPAAVTPDPAQGSTRTFTATFRNASVPAGTPVYFRITGPNAQVRLANTDASGTATIAYQGQFAGRDSLLAVASANGVSLSSNAASVNWTSGSHVTALSLDGSATTGTAGSSVTVRASLTDASSANAPPVGGVAVTFTLGGSTCAGTTSGQGVASCTLTVPDGSNLALQASFAGNAQYTGDSDRRRFFLLAAAGATPPAAPTLGSVVPGPGQVTLFFTTPASDGGSAITGYAATCTPAAAGIAASATGTGSPLVVSGLLPGVAYSCAVAASNAVGTSAPSAAALVTLPAAPDPSAATQPIPTLDARGMVLLATLLALLGAAATRTRRR